MKRLPQLAATFICFAAFAEPLASRTSLMGIHVGESEAQVKRILMRRATFSHEEQGQQVWQMRQDPSVQYVFVGFDRDRRVRYVTTLATPGGKPMLCAPLGDPTSATKTGSGGNIELRRSLNVGGLDLVVIARKSLPDRIDLCAIKKLGSGQGEGEDEAEQRGRKK